MKNLRDSLPSWIDSDRAAAVGSLKVCWPQRSFNYNVVCGALYHSIFILTKLVGRPSESKMLVIL